MKDHVTGLATMTGGFAYADLDSIPPPSQKALPHCLDRPSEEDAANHPLEKRLRAAADQFRANSGLKSSQYSTPVLGLIFLRFTDARFAKHRARHNPNVSPCLNGGFNPVQLGPGRAAPRLAGGDDPRHGCPT